MKDRILAYHRVSDEAAPGLQTWAVKPSVFRRQMAMLHRMGYRGVSVRELLDTLDGGGSGEALAGLSFDDGYLDTVEHAFPILTEFGFTATVYVVSNAIGSETEWEAPGASAPLAGWDGLRKLVHAGWEIGMHSRSHPARFDLLVGDELEREIRGGVQSIEEQLATRVETFAFPHGHYSDEALAKIEAAGYRAALTREPGPVDQASPRYLLPRYEIKHRDTLPEIALLMLTGVQLRRRATFFRFGPARLRKPVRDVHPSMAPETPGRSEDRTKDAA